MTPGELRERTQKFASLIIGLVVNFKKTDELRILGRQLLRSATSIGANYRAACRARSKSEFYSKMCIVVEEADETCYWLELIDQSELSNNLELVKKEAEELLKIFSSARKTFKEQNQK